MNSSSVGPSSVGPELIGHHRNQRGKMELSGFETLFSKNVPHILEKIFLFLDYESYKVCLDVSVVWQNLLVSKTFQMKAKSVFHKMILLDEINLWMAAKVGNKDMVKQILASPLVNPDSDVNNSWSITPILAAAKYGHTDIVQILFDRGADINKRDIFGKTSLYYAAENGKVHTVQVLMNLGAELPLAQAAANGQKGVIMTLLAAGANPNMRDSDGHTALVHAAWAGRLGIVNILLQNGANPNEWNNLRNTPLHFCASLTVEVAKKLIDAGADVNAKNIFGFTPLYLSVKCNKIDMVRILMDNGADENIANDLGDTPLTVARKIGYMNIVDIMTRPQPPGQPQLQPQPFQQPVLPQQPPQQQQHPQQQQPHGCTVQ